MADLPKLPGIPAVTAVKDPVVASILRPVKESLEIIGKAISGEPLPNGGVISGGFNPAISNSTGAASSTYDPTTDYTPPPVPTGLSVAGAFNNINLAWDEAVYLNHAYTEIWRATSSGLGSAELIGSTPGFVYSDPVANHSTYYYWVRFVSQANVEGPYNAATGTVGQTALDPAYALSVLSGSITTSELASTLNTRIDLIDANASVPGSVDARVAVVQGQVNTLLNIPAYDPAETYVTGEQCTYGGNLYAAKTTTTGNLPTNTTYWNLIGNYTTLGDAVAAHTVQIGDLTTGLGQEVSDRTALAVQLRGTYAGTDLNSISSGLLYDERTARAAEDSSLATTISTVSARLNTGGDVANAIVTAQSTASTGVTNAATAQSTADSKVKTFYQGTAPVASAAGDLWVDTANNNLMKRWSGAAWTAVDDLRIGATASTVSTLSTTVAGQTTSISQNTSSINGIRGMYSVKIDNNGVLSGFGLSSTIIDGGTIQSKFLISADEFAVIAPGRTAGNLNSVPFAVLTSAQTINGVSFAAGVYIDGGSINSASIGTAQIANAAIDNAQIANGAITTAKIGDAQITSAKIGDAQVTTAKIGDAQITNAKIEDAAVTNAKISGVIKSADYVAGSAGWQIDKGGAAEFTNATFRGDVTVGSSPAISGTTMTGTGARIYNNGNFAFGNSTSNITWNGSQLSLNGQLIATGNIQSNAASTSTSTVLNVTSSTVYGLNQATQTYTTSYIELSNFNTVATVIIQGGVNHAFQSADNNAYYCYLFLEVESSVYSSGAWSSWATSRAGLNVMVAETVLQANQKTMINNLSRTFYGSSLLNGQYSVQPGVTAIRLRIKKTMYFYNNVTLSVAATTGQAYPGAMWGGNEWLSAYSLVAFQLKV